MKSFFKKSRILSGVSIILLLGTWFVDLAILFSPLKGYSSLAAAPTIWGFGTIANLNLTGSSYYFSIVFSFALVIAWFAAIIPLLLTMLGFIKNNRIGFVLSYMYFLVFQIAFLVFFALINNLLPELIGLTLAAIVLILASFICYVIMGHFLNKEASMSQNQKEERPASVKRIGLGLIFADALGLIGLSSIFFVPIYSLTVLNREVSYTTLSVYADGSILGLCLFMATFVFFVISAFYFVYMLSFFFSDLTKFAKESFSYGQLNLFLSMAFFLMGFSTSYYFSKQGTASSTIAYIPLIIESCVFFALSILKGKYDRAVHQIFEMPIKNKDRSSPKGESLLYLCLITLVTFLSLFLNIVRMEITAGTYSSTLTMTGFKLLSDYSSLGSGYQLLTVYLVCMLLASGFCLLWSFAAFFTDYKSFNKVVKISTYTNVFMVFLLGVSGFYFTIASQINKENIESLMNLYGLSISVSYTYVLTSDAIYALLAEVVVLILMFIRKSFTGEENNIVIQADGQEGGTDNNRLLPSSDQVQNSQPALTSPNAKNNLAEPGVKEAGVNKAAEEKIKDFDPCPAFTEIDSHIDDFNKDMSEREKKACKSPSLEGLVKFVVEYARDSRLHLSYSLEDIATFISGLSACRLSILQGMSGTGKTSLPKIFMEAIDGTCDIVEVESSWKDKNELLGYYNEFSSTYTPRKFTQALYKASLNKEVPTFIVLDEMNLSRIEYYFSDFLSLMENEEDKREIKLVNVNLERIDSGVKKSYVGLIDGHTLKVPANVWFIGTANRDESTFVISDKVYDRAHTMNFNKRAPKVRDFSSPQEKCFYSYDVLKDMMEQAKKKGTFDAENYQVIQSVEVLLRPFNISFGNRILNQIEAFVDTYQACFGQKDVTRQAVETILLSKVVSKLEVKTIDNKEDLAKSFANLGLERCADFISHLNED